MASTFLVRLKVGNILVDARVSRLYQGHPGKKYALRSPLRLPPTAHRFDVPGYAAVSSLNRNATKVVCGLKRVTLRQTVKGIQGAGRRKVPRRLIGSGILGFRFGSSHRCYCLLRMIL